MILRRTSEPGRGSGPVQVVSAIGHFDLASMLEDRELRESVDDLHELQTPWLNRANRTLDRVIDIRRLPGTRFTDETKEP